MVKKTTAGRTPRELAEHIQFAERQIVQPPEGIPTEVSLSLGSITVRPELFQPRVMTTAFDPAQVAKLERTIATKGELEPLLVVKLARKWVCVDGHHRLEAYRKRSWKSPLKCIWLFGTVRDAIDEGVRRNTVVKLELSTGSRQEAAWQRVVLGWGSKREIVELTNVSEGIVALMRRVMKAHRADDQVGAELRERLRGDIKQVSWQEARAAYTHMSPAEWDHVKAAEKLATQLRRRMEGRLSENVVVTALALQRYDEDLPRRLLGALKELMADQEEQEGAREEADESEDLREEDWYRSAQEDM